MESAEIRARWLRFFETGNSQGLTHTVVPSASLIAFVSTLCPPPRNCIFDIPRCVAVNFPRAAVSINSFTFSLLVASKSRWSISKETDLIVDWIVVLSAFTLEKVSSNNGSPSNAIKIPFCPFKLRSEFSEIACNVDEICREVESSRIIC